MNVKIKTSFIIILTLIVGIVIGALASRAFLQNRVQQVFSMRNPTAFTQSYIETIKPDANQEKKIKEILERNGQILNEIRSKSREDMESSMLAMMSELESVLTPEQIKRIEDNPLGGRSRFGMRSPEEELDYLSTELDLTEDQTSKLKRILNEFRMMPPETMERGTPKEMSSSFREQRQKRELEINNILSESQKKKYNELMQNRQKRSPGRNRNTPL